MISCHKKLPVRLGSIVCLGLVIFAPTNSAGSDDRSNEDLVRVAHAFVRSEQTWNSPAVQGRSVPLFVSVPIVERDGILIKPDEPIPQVCPPLSNEWILKNGLDFLDSSLASRDPDRDGFSNLEEFEAETDPRDSGNHPSRMNKLQFLGEQMQVFPYRYKARLDESTVQVDRLFPGRPGSQSSILRTGQTTKDGLLRLGGISDDSVEATFLRSGQRLSIAKGSTVTATVSYAEFRDPFYEKDSFFIEEGESFSLPSTPGETLLLDSVTSEFATVTDREAQLRTIPIIDH